MNETRATGASSKALQRLRGRRRLWLVAGAAVAAVLLVARLCFFTVGTAQYALVLEFGRPVGIIDAPGLRFKLPYRSVQILDKRLYVYTPPPSEFLTLEKTPVVAQGAILWRIADPKRFFETVFDRQGAESRLGDILSAALGAAVARSPFTTFVSLDPAAYGTKALLAAVTRKCRDTALRDYGIAVVDVQLQSFDYPRQNRQRVYARMVSERGQMSMRYRSEGDEAGLKVRAAAEEQKARIIARATETAQRRRGEGDSDAARIYAEAISADPKYYRFLQTMQAARAIVHPGTTMVLPADSELFGLLFDSDHYVHSHAGAGKSARWIGINRGQEDKTAK